MRSFSSRGPASLLIAVFVFLALAWSPPASADKVVKKILDRDEAP